MSKTMVNIHEAKTHFSKLLARGRKANASRCRAAGRQTGSRSCRGSLLMTLLNLDKWVWGQRPTYQHGNGSIYGR
jgi:hypothetical protein